MIFLSYFVILDPTYRYLSRYNIKEKGPVQFRALVVLREDATYVRSVVDQLGLLAVAPDEVWSSLFGFASKRSPLPPTKGHKKQTKADQTLKTMLVNKEGFVESMQHTMKTRGSFSKKRSAAGAAKSVMESHDLLANFFQSFALHQGLTLSQGISK